MGSRGLAIPATVPAQKWQPLLERSPLVATLIGDPTIVEVPPRRNCQQKDCGKRKKLTSHDAPPDSWKQLSHSCGYAAMGARPAKRRHTSLQPEPPRTRLCSNKDTFDVEDVCRGVSIGGLGNHALNVFWGVIGQASHDNRRGIAISERKALLSAPVLRSGSRGEVEIAPFGPASLRCRKADPVHQARAIDL